MEVEEKNVEIHPRRLEWLLSIERENGLRLQDQNRIASLILVPGTRFKCPHFGGEDD